ncbi:MAG: DNA polymerase I [Oscillospiraceae bacterium]|jgi:DNA polymerase-1|nr:DNA polymerase I [Oscillospiraceae bacterium]
MKYLLIDGNSIISRAFYAIKSTLTAPDGTPTGAVFGFFRIIDKVLPGIAPDRIIAVFDRKEPTFRKRMYDGYKAQRHPTPEDLLAQIPVVREILAAQGRLALDLPGYEADDLLGTFARQAEENGDTAVVMTGDRDSLQLITDATQVLYISTAKGQTTETLYDTAAFNEKYGFAPINLIDCKALMGDASDNIPGVRGVGEKTALGLIQRFGSLDSVYDNIDDTSVSGSVRQKLTDGRDDAQLSYTLAKIVTDAPISLGDVTANAAPEDFEKLRALYAKLGLRSMLKKLEDAAGIAPEPEEAPAELLEIPANFDLSAVANNALESSRLGEAIQDVQFDTALAAFLLDSGGRQYDTAALAEKYLGRTIRQSNLLENYDEENNKIVYNLYLLLTQKLKENGLDRLFYDIEMPLIAALADMEKSGIAIDKQALAEFGESLAVQIASVQESIFALCGEEFLISSTKQLGEMLFEKLGLHSVKNTKTGYSTDAETLEKIEYAHPVVSMVLQYRELTKLKSTYVDGIIKFIRPDGRIHTKFNMTAASTGRLSSSEPNMQNIPVRREQGTPIRGMFRAKEGHLFLDADYSQIELRVLAHMSQDAAMIAAFNSGADFHTLTAAEAFGKTPETVTKEDRRRAKAVNFGIVYGISAFSLAKDIGTTVSEAKQYMDRYFELYPRVREFMESCKTSARENGYVTTMFGRRRYFPDIRSSNRQMREFSERAAMNAPVQGTAADIIKLAMINIHKRLKDELPEAKMLLQVHDEILLEAPEGTESAASKILEAEMRGAAELSVPLLTEVSFGRSWLACK